VQALILMNGAGLDHEHTKDLQVMKECMVEMGLDAKNYWDIKFEGEMEETKGETLKPEGQRRKVYEMEQTLRFRHGMMCMGKGLRTAAKIYGWHINFVNRLSEDWSKPMPTEDLLGSEENHSGRFVDALKDCVSGEMSKKEGLKVLVILDNC